MTQIPLGTRIRTTIKFTASLFRRSYDSPLRFHVIPPGSTGKIASAALTTDGKFVYAIQLETVSQLLSKAGVDDFEVIADDIEPSGHLVYVENEAINTDIRDMNNYPDGYNLVQMKAEEHVKISQDDSGAWSLRWDFETWETINRLRGVVEAK